MEAVSFGPKKGYGGGMKIEGPNSTKRTGETKKASKSSSSGGASFARALSSGGGEVESRPGVHGSVPTSSVDSILAIQEADDATSGRSRGLKARKWGEDILDRLEDIRTGLLLGTIPKDRLERLAALIRERKNHSVDPRLKAILDDIELRAEVELAKYESLYRGQ